MQSSHYIAVKTGLLNTVVVIVECVCFFREKNLINFPPPSLHPMLVNVFLICTFIVRSIDLTIV